MISFIIPVYNKGPILFKTLTSLIRHLKMAEILDFEIIIVNDGSTDDSLTQAIKFREFNGATDKIKIFNYQKNIGKGFALRFGYSKSCGDPVVFLDGDLDINTRQIIKAVHLFQTHKIDMIIGSKYHRLSRTQYPVNRFFYSLILKGMIKVLFNLDASDTQVGLKLFRRHVLSQVFPRLVIKRFAVDLELLVVAKMMGFDNIMEIPVKIHHTSANSSTINLLAVKNFCQDIAAIWYRKNVLKFYATTQQELSPMLSVQSV